MQQYSKAELVEAFVTAASGLDHIHDGRERAVLAFHYLLGYFGVANEVLSEVSI